MTTWLITRHPGAIEWATRHGIAWDKYVAHLDPNEITTGDTVIGTLPVHLAAIVCANGGRYFNLSLDLPAHWRGRELNADELEACNARFEQYDIKRIK